MRRPLPSGIPAPSAVVGSVTLSSLPDRVALRIPLTQRVPFQVIETRTSPHAPVLQRGRRRGLDSVWQGHADPAAGLESERHRRAELHRRAHPAGLGLPHPLGSKRSPARDTAPSLHLVQPSAAGTPHRRRSGPPASWCDRSHRIAGGRCQPGRGPAASRRCCKQAGAHVIMTRTADTAVDLWSRVTVADTSGAELLVSIHNNALPDGVNPFTNNGTTVFYNQPRSLPLAAEIQRALVRRLRLPDLGIGRADLALIRPTWMPAALSEGNVRDPAGSGGPASVSCGAAALCSRCARGHPEFPSGTSPDPGRHAMWAGWDQRRLLRRKQIHPPRLRRQPVGSAAP